MYRIKNSLSSQTEEQLNVARSSLKIIQEHISILKSLGIDFKYEFNCTGLEKFILNDFLEHPEKPPLSPCSTA